MTPPTGGGGLDVFAPATSDMVVACVSRDRWFDLDAVRQPYGERSKKNAGYPTSYHADPAAGYDERARTVSLHPAGAPPLDWWQHDPHVDNYNPPKDRPMGKAYWVTGDTRDVTAHIPDGSIDLILTSPPFLALRSYLPADHPDKHREIGSETTPAAFIDMLLGLTAEWRRVLAPHGSFCVELGDTYAGAGGGGGFDDALERKDARNGYGGAADRVDALRPGTRSRVASGVGWPLDKSLCLIPELFRVGLVYGLNPLTGQESPAGRWRARNVVRWVRPNPPVGALGDKFRPATSDLVVACVARDRWFDLDAVRTEYADITVKNKAQGRPALGPKAERTRSMTHSVLTQAGAPPLDWWQIVPGGFTGAHYAVFPPELCTKPIEAMCPRRVCLTCGQPSRRETGEATYPGSVKDGARADNVFMRGGHSVAGTTTGSNAGLTRSAPTTGWSTCGCPGTDGISMDGYHTGTGWRAGRVLDPFAGSGTVAAVASGRGRDSIGIDIDDRNADLAVERVGMFLEQTSPVELAALLSGVPVEPAA